MKPSTKLHIVYDTSRRLIVFSGSRTACNKFWVQKPAQTRQTLVVSAAPR